MRRSAALSMGAKTPVVLPAIGASFMGGYYAGIIDTTKGNIIPADTSQTGLRYALIVAPKSLPGEMVAPLNAAIVQALTEPGVPERFAKMGTYLHTSTPEAFQALIKAELPKWAEVVQRAGIKID